MVDTLLISALLEQLTSIIYQHAEEKVRLVVGVKEEVCKLTNNFPAIQAVIEDAERGQLKEATDRQQLEKLKDVSYDMDDVLDEWNTAILKMQIEGGENAPRPKKTVLFFILFSSFCCGQVALRHDIAVKIKELNKTLIAIGKDKYNFNSRGIEQLERQMSASVIDVAEVRGRNQDKNTIIEKLLSKGSQGPTLHTISIVGMGGIGKTTLAQLVYNDDTIKTHFQKRVWVCVSDPFDEIRIAKAILEALTGATPNLNELDSLLQHISQSIEGKKFLLVLDDVWNEDSTKWKLLKNSLKCGSPGSRILITTRKENVAINMGTADIDIFTLGTLSKKDCWSLFSDIAFFGRPREECEKLEDISWEVVDKCKGLPLAGKALGSLLRFKKTREQWQRVLDNEVWELKEAERGLFPLLLLSYYDLSSTMRRCFSYCAIFPKNYLLDRDTLIKLWMAQGYLKATGNEEMEMIGEECFENLAMHSFFQDFVRDKNGSIIRCKMHDIVHDFAQFLTKNECLVMDVSSPKERRIESLEKVHHLMIKLENGDSIPISIYDLKKLRSLIVDKSGASSPIDLVLPKLFDQLTCLRSLDFTYCGLKELSGVDKLIHLRYLNLRVNAELKALPETLCELCNLQFLNVTYCTGLKQLPHGLGKLINLRHLEINYSFIEFMPKGIERLTSLCKLDNFVVSNDVEASTLEGLKNLNHLRGKLHISGLAKVRDLDEIKKAQLQSKVHLLDLSLSFLGAEAEGRMINDEQVIEVIQPPPNLEQLIIDWYAGRNVFPNWIMSLTNLKKLTIASCYNCEFLPPLGKLWFLESLGIHSMGSVKRVGIEFLGIESANTSLSSVIAFPKLQQLCFAVMENWEEWDYGMTRRMGEEQDITTATTIIIMPNLLSLEIDNCAKLKALPNHLLHLTSLEILHINCSSILEERYYKARKGKDWLKISHIPDIRINKEYVKKEGRLL